MSHNALPAKDQNKTIRNRKNNYNIKSKPKEQNTKRQKIVLSVTAGHIRGGHSYH